MDASPASSISYVVLSWVLSSRAEGLGFNNLAVLLVGWVGAVVGEDIVLLRSWRLRIELAHITLLCVKVVVEVVLVLVVVRSVVRAHHWTVVLEVAFVHVVVLLTVAVAILVIALILWTLVKALIVILVVALVVVMIVIEVVLVVSLRSHHALIHGLVSVVACLGLVAHLDWVSVWISLDGSLLFITHNDGYDNTC